jgi:hypothetical protein
MTGRLGDVSSAERSATQCVLVTKHTTLLIKVDGRRMKTSFAISLLLGAAMYAAVGLFGVVAFHDAGPVSQGVDDGYGIAYTSTAKAESSAPMSAR